MWILLKWSTSLKKKAMKNNIAKLLFILLLLGSYFMQAQTALLDEPVRAGELTLYQSVQEPHTYYYLLDKVRLATHADGTPQFSFMNYVQNVRSEAGEEEIKEGEGGGIIHGLFELYISPEQIRTAENELRQIDGEGVIKGPLSYESGTVALISSAQQSDGTMARQVVGLGAAPVLDGQKVAISVQLTKLGAKVLWESFQLPTPDFTISFQMKIEGYRSPIKAKIEADFDKIYQNHTLEAGMAMPYLGAEIKAAFEQLSREGAIKVTQIGSDQDMEKAINAAYEKILTMMFEPIGGSNAIDQMKKAAGSKSMLDKATELLAKQTGDTQKNKPEAKKEDKKATDKATADTKKENKKETDKATADAKKEGKSDTGPSLKLDAAVTAMPTPEDDVYIRLFRDKKYVVLSKKEKKYQVTTLPNASLDDLPGGWEKIDAASYFGSSKIKDLPGYKGESKSTAPQLKLYLKGKELYFVDKSVGIDYRTQISSLNLPKAWTEDFDGFDAACFNGGQGGKERVYLFYGSSYVIYDKETKKLIKNEPQHILTLFLPIEWEDGVDAAFYYGKENNHHAMVIVRGDQYIIYDLETETATKAKKFSETFGLPEEWVGKKEKDKSLADKTKKESPQKEEAKKDDKSTPWALAASYQMKVSRQTGKFNIDLNKHTTRIMPFRFDQNIGKIDCENCFHQVNIDNPLYKQREIYVRLDGMNAADFDQYLNFVDVMMRKKHQAGDLTFDEVKIDRSKFNLAGNNFKLLYGWKEDNNREKWLDYEYKVTWNFFGGEEHSTDWVTTNTGIISLSPPIVKRTISLESSEELSAEKGIRTILVKLYYGDLYKDVRVNTGRGEYIKEVNLFLPSNDLKYDYQILWYTRSGEEIEFPRKSTTTPFIFIDEADLQN
jgi:hypothetical protein